MNKTLLSIISLLACAGTMYAEDVPAFPGAEGLGRYTTGGRGGTVYHVTSLADDGSEGTLRWALGKSGKKTIVFDVGGYIDLKSDLNVSANTTIAGQTAPYPGITLRYFTLNVTKGDNVIIRFIRSRRSQVKNVNDGADAIWGRNHSNIILDHCSFSWCIDEVASFYDNKNFTMQWCSLGEALANGGHGKGAHSYGGIWGGKNASFHHNFLVHLQNRVPRFNGARYGWSGYDKDAYANTVMAERVDFRNCVMYNWGTGGCYGGPGGGFINMVNNYYQAGPATKNKTRVTQVSVNDSGNGDKNHPELFGYSSRYFIDGNYVEAASNPESFDWQGVAYDSGFQNLNGERYIKITSDMTNFYEDDGTFKTGGGGSTTFVPVKLTAPIEPGVVTTHDAKEAYNKVLDFVGSSLYRDAVDARYVEEARTGTATYTGTVTGQKGIIDLIADPSDPNADPRLVAYPELEPSSRPANFDTDGDGIPDEWEKANGLNPADKTDGNKYTVDPKGLYTNLEVYLNSIVESIMKRGNAGALSSVDEYYPAWNDPAGIDDVVATPGQVERIEYFNLQGVKLSEPVPGVNIRRIYYTDGTYSADKVIK